jgi:tripeptide aminopeptidase
MIDHERLLDTFISLVRIDSPSGEEVALRTDLEQRLQELSVETHVDETGNLVGRLPGQGDPLLLSAHMDTVPGRGIQPTVREGVVYSDGTTVLGADDKSGIAVMLEVLTVLQTDAAFRPAIEIALSVGEEVGLLGAKGLDVDWFQANQALVLDMGGPLNVVVRAAPASDKFDAVVHGRAAHAGANPEAGINAIAVAAQGIAAMPLGRIDDETTANVGLIQGGSAVNVVPDRVALRGEARSHDVFKLDAQIRTMRSALETAVAVNEGARLDLEIERAYTAFRLEDEAPLLQRVGRALEAMGQAERARHRGCADQHRHAGRAHHGRTRCCGGYDALRRVCTAHPRYARPGRVEKPGFLLATIGRPRFLEYQRGERRRCSDVP